MEDTVAKAQDLGDVIITWFVQESATLLMNLLLFIVILIIGHFAIKVGCSLFRSFLNKQDRVSEILENFTINVTHKILWVVLVMMALPQLGIEVGPLIAGLGVTGFIVGFAFQESLGNLAAGLMLLLNQPFQKGDVVEAGGVFGSVRDMNVMATTIVSPDNKKIMVPNKSIWGGSIINYGAMGTRRVDLTMGISYGSDITKAKEVAHEVLKSVPLILEDPAPVVEVSEMADSSVNFVVRPWCKSEDYWNVYWTVNHKLKEALDANGLEIPFPQMDVHLPEGLKS